MIISQLNSGLGNQMFQYAAAKSLATIKKTSLCLDISWYLSKELKPRVLKLLTLIEQDVLFTTCNQSRCPLGNST